MSTEVKLSNVPKMSAGTLVTKLSTAYTEVLNNGSLVKAFPSVMLWGPPGIGKSQAVKQIAKEIEIGTGKRTSVTDVRLLLFNPIDLRGIPTANEDKTLSVWLKPEIFKMDESEDVVNILFLDEISAAPQSVQAAAYQIALDRVIGEHSLPDNCIVIAAGNRTTDKSVAYKMPKALANRLLHIEIVGSFEAWREWAVSSGINPKVIGFLSFKPDMLMKFDAASEDLAFSTPRSWEMVSNILNNVSEDLSLVYSFISGVVGIGAATEFRHWCKIYNKLPNIEDIFDGTTGNADVPTDIDVLFALISSMVSYARGHKDEMDKINNSLEYAKLLPTDYCVVLLKDYMYIEKGYKEKLIKCPAFVELIVKHGKALNGNN